MNYPTLTVFDVGARGGTHSRWHRCASPPMIVGFDADVEECNRLNQTSSPGRRFLPYALGDADGLSVPFHVTRSPGSSSLLRPNSELVQHFRHGAAMEVVRTCSVTLTRLDTVCRTEGLMPDVLKIDVQGAELSVLHGASAVLPHVLLVEAEVGFNPQYTNQPLFGVVDGFLRSRGFALLGLRRVYWRRIPFAQGPWVVHGGGTLMHGDALWLNERRLLDADESTVFKAIVGLATYRQLDYVRWLLLTHPAVNRTDADRLAILRDVADVPSAWARVLSRLMARVAKHRRWREWVDRCNPPTATAWHDPHEFF